MVNLKNILLQYIALNFKNLPKTPVYTQNDEYIFLFDIDDTLYKSTQDFHIDERNALKKCYNFYKNSMPNHNDVPDFDDFIQSHGSINDAFFKVFNKTPLEVEIVKNFNYGDYLREDKELQLFFSKFPYKSWCFTNGIKMRAEMILESLGLTKSFIGVFCKDDGCDGEFILRKPKKETYEFVEKYLNIKNKSKVYFFDDNQKNITIGEEMGWNCILIDNPDNILDILKRIKDQLQEEEERRLLY
ncbi:putative haloacid dehalogenase-like hydrolase [Vairimorpha necatrix]|uniref:Haloacid dehalogenase-like hydrolase n=1 Tax=Vairimorpha necatrix TaxID=6039 RepID=A0AAX4JFU8_9MICR